MKTLLLKESEIKKAADIIKQGGTVVFRTETVYGIGADATRETAVAKVFGAKNRPPVNPLIIHFDSLKTLFKKFPDVDLGTRHVLNTVKSALTVILPRPEWIPLITTGGLETVAIRVPDCKFAQKFIKKCGLPLAAPSANTSTRPSPTRWEDAHDDLNGRVDAILCGTQTQIGVESTVVKVIPLASPPCSKTFNKTDYTIQILRLGGVNSDELTKLTGIKVLYHPTKESPGTQFKHYSPKCPLLLVDDAGTIGDYSQYNDLIKEFRTKYGRFPKIKIIRKTDLGKNGIEVAKNLFSKIRDLEKDADYIVCERFPDTVEYQTINERLQKASSN